MPTALALSREEWKRDHARDDWRAWGLAEDLIDDRPFEWIGRYALRQDLIEKIERLEGARSR